MIWLIPFFALFFVQILSLKTILFDDGESISGNFGFIVDFREIRSGSKYFYSAYPKEIVTVTDNEVQTIVKKAYQNVFIFKHLIPIKPQIEEGGIFHLTGGEGRKFYAILQIPEGRTRDIALSRIESDFAVNVASFISMPYHKEKLLKYKTDLFEMPWNMLLSANPSPLIDQPFRCLNEILILLDEMKRKGFSGDAPKPLFENSIVIGKNILGKNLLKLIVPAVVGCRIDDFIQTIHHFKGNYINLVVAKIVQRFYFDRLNGEGVNATALVSQRMNHEQGTFEVSSVQEVDQETSHWKAE
jgi:hypothetical protein